MKIWKMAECESSPPEGLFIEKLADYDDLSGGLENEEVGNKYTIEVVEMPKEEFDNLLEWDGW